MRRLLLVLAGMASALALSAAPAAATGVSASTKAAACVSSSTATYRHSFNGAAGTLTITATHPLCAGQSQPVTLASYTASGAPGTAASQFIYDSAGGTITSAKRSLTLRVAVPACYAQVDAFFGTAIQTEATSTAAPYATAKLGSKSGLGARSTGALAWHTGGATACAPAPTITYAMACDGTFTATLANAADANATAVFMTGSRRIRLSPGRSTSIKVAKSQTLTVRDSSFTTHVAAWRAPTTCTVSPTAGPTRAATPQIPATRPTTTGPATVSPSPSASPSSSPGPTYTEAPAVYATFPDDTTASTALSKTGMGTGSIIAIAIGLLMIGTGVAAITYLVRLNRSLA
ncbi:hypothetical protein ACIA5D_38235 [Actinoplanes sp. NPDC051513]|uniref:hypothetical protein n=1 Tax=Actinoplanes sp. NPDC051513 TaxID=3363908 RepID=UPI003797FAD9